MKTYKYPSIKPFSAVSPITKETFRKFETEEEAKEWCLGWTKKQDITVELHDESGVFEVFHPEL